MPSDKSVLRVSFYAAWALVYTMGLPFWDAKNRQGVIDAVRNATDIRLSDRDYSILAELSQREVAEDLGIPPWEG